MTSQASIGGGKQAAAASSMPNPLPPSHANTPTHSVYSPAACAPGTYVLAPQAQRRGPHLLDERGDPPRQSNHIYYPSRHTLCPHLLPPHTHSHTPILMSLMPHTPLVPSYTPPRTPHTPHTPHTPLIPHTPLVPSYTPPRTPHTPHTPLIPPSYPTHPSYPHPSSYPHTPLIPPPILVPSYTPPRTPTRRCPALLFSGKRDVRTDRGSDGGDLHLFRRGPRGGCRVRRSTSTVLHPTPTHTRPPSPDPVPPSLRHD